MQELKALNTKPLAIVEDLNNIDAPQNIINRVLDYYGNLDILINNAGYALSKPLLKTNPDEWENIMAVNVRAPYFLCKYAIPHLQKSKASTIINISSVVGRLGYENQSAYAATKHALMGFSKVLAKEIQPLGIRLHTIAPGGVATDMAQTMRPDLDTSNLIKPGEIAEIILFLLQNRGNAMIDEINIRRANGTPFT